MVTFLHRIGRSLAAVLVLASFCQCTTREVKSTRSTFTFAGSGDENKLREKFAESGYSIAEDGSIKADNENLFAGEKPRGLDGDFQTRNARFRKSKVATNEFSTPEYLQRQEFRGARETDDFSNRARENGATESRQSNRLFKSRSERAVDYDSIQTASVEGSNRRFETGGNRELNRAYDNSVVADGVRQEAGYRQNVALSMDDVKKMLSPGQYARATGIE
ncbi:MAG: hypothetical protein P1U85_02970 [Verrucomicrobiales bacterium]|nr:hypothetical protein [Verrucomicrobiales bacterium]